MVSIAVGVVAAAVAGPSEVMAQDSDVLGDGSDLSVEEPRLEFLVDGAVEDTVEGLVGARGRVGGWVWDWVEVDEEEYYQRDGDDRLGGAHGGDGEAHEEQEEDWGENKGESDEGEEDRDGGDAVEEEPDHGA